MTLKIPSITLNEKVVAKDINLYAESFGRFRVKGIGIRDSDTKTFDIAIISTEFILDGFSPSFKSTGMLMDTKQQFNIKGSFSWLNKSCKITFTMNNEKKVFNTENVLEALNKIKDNICFQ